MTESKFSHTIRAKHLGLNLPAIIS